MAFQSLTADGTLTFILPANSTYHTITVDGGFGGGTATFFKREGSSGSSIAIKDSAGAVISVTAPASFDADIAAGEQTNTAEQTAILVTLTGATNPTFRAVLNTKKG